MTSSAPAVLPSVVLVNPPHTAIGSRIPREHLPPLGLLSIGGPLVDAGYAVRLVDGDLHDLSIDHMVSTVLSAPCDVVMIGHSGSSSAHPTVVAFALALKQAKPDVWLVYGGVHPSYHWDEILKACAAIDVIVRGEGEHTVVQMLNAWVQRQPLREVAGLAFRVDGQPIATPDARLIRDLDAYRVAWELIDHRHYSYWGGKRAVVAQFSRGCPHLCSYCGQRGFWTQWRHRDPVRFAQELARLHREQGVELINFADELPTGSRKAWQAFLEALIAENVPLLLVGSTRAGDIVRDADILHLYKKAGVIRFLLGIESYRESTLNTIQKGATQTEDQQAIALLRAHGILSMATYVIGFDETRDMDFWHSYRHLLRYDPDQVQLLHVTPHRWTPFYATVEDRPVIETDTRRWDYKHQVLASPELPAWRIFVWFKCLELALQLRPKVLRRMWFNHDPDYRHAMRWYTGVGRRVWFHEVADFIRHLPRYVRPAPASRTLKNFLGSSLAVREYVLNRKKS